MKKPAAIFCALMLFAFIVVTAGIMVPRALSYRAEKKAIGLRLREERLGGSERMNPTLKLVEELEAAVPGETILRDATLDRVDRGNPYAVQLALYNAMREGLNRNQPYAASASSAALHEYVSKRMAYLMSLKRYEPLACAALARKQTLHYEPRSKVWNYSFAVDHATIVAIGEGVRAKTRTMRRVKEDEDLFEKAMKNAAGSLPNPLESVEGRSDADACDLLIAHNRAISRLPEESFIRVVSDILNRPQVTFSDEKSLKRLIEGVVARSAKRQNETR